MTHIENILNQAMSLRPSDRALLAQKLINSLSIEEDDIEQQWLELAEHRLKEIKNGSVKPISWKEIRNAVKH
jgi:putative addiction module component (TIGR02574 family)